MLLIVTLYTEGGDGNSDRPEFCNMTPEVGRCRGAMRRFYYNSVNDECVTFIYGGCGGNENNFESEDECKSTCKTGGSAAGVSAGTTTTGGPQPYSPPECPSIAECKLDCTHGYALDDRECYVCQCLEPCAVSTGNEFFSD